MEEGIPFQAQLCRWQPQYQEEEYYYPPKDQCRGLQLLAEGYPLFHQCFCQSYGTGETPLKECQCHRGRRVHFGDEPPPQNLCGWRKLPAEGHPPPDHCRCRQVPIVNDQCGCRQPPAGGHPTPDHCRCRQVPACGRRETPAGGHPTQDQCRCRQVPIGNGDHPQDQCRGGREVSIGDVHPPQHGQQLPATDGPHAQDQRRGHQTLTFQDDQFQNQEQPDGEEQPRSNQNGGGKTFEQEHTPGDQHRGQRIIDPGHHLQRQNNFTGKRRKKNPSHYKSGASGPARSLCTCISIFLLLVSATILVLWLIYRPHKPRFAVVGAAIYDLNATIPPFMSTTMQFTIIIRNPNKRVSIYYDKLSAFVSYKNQAITAEAMMPPLHMNKRSTVAVSPVIGGTPVQVSMEVTNGLAIDEIYGVMGLNLVLEGRLRWKIFGAIKTKHHGIHVNCELMLDLKKGCGGPVPLLESPVCNVDI